jgi:CheY-like chemotaxis protein/glycine cleavage system H lipoate-binding protein
MDVKFNILVVDDEQIVLDSIRRHLRNELDIEIFSAISVHDALDIIEEFDINIILTDLMMPDIDGMEFLKIIQEKKPNILMIMITGYATINTALQAMQHGAFDYIAKPFTKDELKKVIRRAYDIVIASYAQNLDTRAIFELEKSGSSIKRIGKNIWMMQLEDKNVIIGVERPFLIGFGKIQTVYLPEKGDEIIQGSSCFQIFSTDMKSQSLLSPLSGTVVEVNTVLLEDPNSALQDPYGDGWILKIRPSHFEDEIKLIGF